MAFPVFSSFAGYRRDFFVGDLIAGLTLAAIAIPEQMATARLGGFNHTSASMPSSPAPLDLPRSAATALSCGADSPSRRSSPAAR